MQRYTLRSGYNAATSRAMAQKTARRERIIALLEEGYTKEQCMEKFGITRSTLNLYLRYRRKT